MLEVVTETEDYTAQTESAINAMVQELYANSHRTLRPLYPWVLVRVLDKDQMYKGLIVLPDKVQNKVTHEGIVVCTWKEFVQETGKVYSDDKGSHTRCTVRRSGFEIGDHVLFHHWAGLPTIDADPDRYRLVKECSWDPSTDGGIFAVVEHDSPENSIHAKLAEILGNDAEGTALAHKIADEFLLIDKAQKSITLSGR